MSLFPSSSSPSFIALHKASSNRFCIPLMIHGARSPPISLPAHISIPPSFPSLLDVVGTTASSYAIRFQSLEEIPILVSLFSPLVSRTRSQSHPVTCLTALRRQIQTLRLCASRSFSFFSVLLNLFWGQSPNASGQSNVVSFCPGIVVIPPRLPSLRPHQLGSSTTVTSTLTRRQGLMGCRTSSSRQGMVECPSPLIQSAPTLSCTQRPGES
jgi:hypothetical protein